MCVVAVGLGGVALAHSGALHALHWIGAAFLLWLAWKIATPDRGGETARHEPVGFVGAAAFQWVNPKSWLVCASAAGAYLEPGGNALVQAAALGGLFILASLPCCFVWLAFGAAAQRVLGTERRLRTFNIVMGALPAASVTLILF